MTVDEFTASCDCRSCLDETWRAKPPSLRTLLPPTSMRMVVCAVCGNKRCPKATNHRNACTNSNEPGQAGSVYR